TPSSGAATCTSRRHGWTPAISAAPRPPRSRATRSSRTPTSHRSDTMCWPTCTRGRGARRMRRARRPRAGSWEDGVRADRWVLLATCLLGGCAPRPQPAAPRDARHVLFITIDTLRADRLGAYGSREVATPNMDRLAREGALALEAVAQAPITRPSHMSMF